MNAIVQINGIQNINPKVPIIDLSIEEDTLYCDVNKLISIIRKNWNLKNIIHKVFKNGYTNKLISCIQSSDEETKSDVILIRVYGTGSSLMIDRKQEFIAMSVLSSIRCSAPLYAKFNNGIAYGYNDGVVLDKKLIIQPEIQRLVIKEMIRIHSTDVNALASHLGFDYQFNTVPDLFPTMRKWLCLIPNKIDDELKSKGFEDLNWNKDLLNCEINLLEKELTVFDSPIVFCHNDLLLKNIIYCREKGKISFIDFEYASYNYQAFDIANHFCEYAGMDELDFSLYPSHEYQFNWLRTYLNEVKKLEGSDDEVTDYHVESLYVKVNKFALAAHIYWALWGIIQSLHSKIDFNYLTFAKLKLDEYRLKKKKVPTATLR